MAKRKIIIFVALLILVAGGLRFFRLTDRGLYFPDETRYYRYAVKGCEVLSNDSLRNAVRFAGDTFSAKPGHTMLGIIGMKLLGISQYSVLIVNAFLGVLTVVIIFLITNTFYTSGAALIAALTLTLSGLHIHYSRSF